MNAVRGAIWESRKVLLHSGNQSGEDHANFADRICAACKLPFQDISIICSAGAASMTVLDFLGNGIEPRCRNDASRHDSPGRPLGPGHGKNL